MEDEKHYPTDLTDAQWAIVAPLLPKEKVPGTPGRPRQYDNRQVLNAILYLVRTGCQWRNLPRDFPPYGTVFHYFSLWNKDGTLESLHAELRKQMRVAAGRSPQPSVVIIDSQSVKTTEKGGLKAGRPPLATMPTRRSRAASVIWQSTRPDSSGL